MLPLNFHKPDKCYIYLTSITLWIFVGAKKSYIHYSPDSVKNCREQWIYEFFALWKLEEWDKGRFFKSQFI